MKLRLNVFLASFLTVFISGISFTQAGDSTVVIRGSHALYLTLEPHMKTINRATKVNVDFSKPGGCGDAVKNVTTGGGVGAVCCHLDDAELARMGGAVLHPLALEPLMITINKKNRVKNLTTAQVRMIMSGKIKNWNEVGGADQKIVVVMRPHCGPRPGHWKTILPREQWQPHIKVDKFLTMITTVAKLPGAIGHLGSVLYDPKMMNVVKVDGIDPLDPAVFDKGYPFFRPISLALPASPTAAETKVATFLESPAAKHFYTEKYVVPSQRFAP
ncbi:MAG: substrate-binding domain-containing protein [Magnetococcales bacterium]|nr:substrate-binding domain-containing protein [Magnetococcales bacterium]